MGGVITGMDFEAAAGRLQPNFLVTPPHEFENAWIVRTSGGAYGEGDTFLDALEAAATDTKNRNLA